MVYSVTEKKQTIHLRSIRSFVRRQGRMSKTKKEAIPTLWQRYGLDRTDHLLDLDAVFQRSSSRILEIGFGMGDSLLRQAQENPAQDYIGIEVHKPGVAALLTAMDTNNVTNVRLFCADANEILKHCIPADSLDAIQIFFPDPWPKRRHHKRRLIQPSFIELLRPLLKTQAKLHLATDWQDYAQQMLTVLSEIVGFQNLAGEKQFAPRPKERPLTKFETRGQQLGHNVWDLVFVKE